jgi:DNA (cytosine-5)-methyltransferase 1
VPGLLSGGLDIVHGDLVRLGYRHRVGWASACSVGAPHMRRRLLGVAHAGSEGWGPRRAFAGSQGQAGIKHEKRVESAGGAWWAVEPDVRRVAYGVPSRLDRCKGLGNSVVPQVAEHVGRLIMAA